ncbi:MAG TPA: ABC transporter substrate-binding protein [Chloroflexota bacterium]|nr:ABC transporter substrate-binding protein [Chloroflexota bacterium]
MSIGRVLGPLVALLFVVAFGCTGPSATPTAAPAKPGATSAPATAPTSAPTAAQSQPTATQPASAAQPQATSVPGAAPTSGGAAAKPEAGGQLVKVKAAYPQPSAVQTPVYVAKEEGFFASYGLDVELNRVGGPAQAAALISGELQFGNMGANEVASAVLNGGPLVMIATFSDLPVFSLYADKKYTSVQELSGQSIGVTQAGSSTDAAAHIFLKHFDMTDRVHIVASGGTIPGVLAAMESGVVAGGILSPPTTQKAEEEGYAELVNGVKLGVPMNHSGVSVNKNFLKDHPDQVKAFLTAFLDGWKFVADPANKATVVKVIAKYTETDDRLGAVGYEAMVPVWSSVKVPKVTREAVANLLDVSGVANAQSASPEQFFDNSLIESLAG